MTSKLPDDRSRVPHDTAVEGDAAFQQLRDELMSKYSGQAEASKVFSKSAKDKVGSPRIRQASHARRTHEARFTCPFEDCYSDFTRNHNLKSKQSSIYL